MHLSSSFTLEKIMNYSSFFQRIMNQKVMCLNFLLKIKGIILWFLAKNYKHYLIFFAIKAEQWLNADKQSRRLNNKQKSLQSQLWGHGGLYNKLHGRLDHLFHPDVWRVNICKEIFHYSLQYIHVQQFCVTFQPL